MSSAGQRRLRRQGVRRRATARPLPPIGPHGGLGSCHRHRPLPPRRERASTRYLTRISVNVQRVPSRVLTQLRVSVPPQSRPIALPRPHGAQRQAGVGGDGRSRASQSVRVPQPWRSRHPGADQAGLEHHGTTPRPSGSDPPRCPVGTGAPPVTPSGCCACRLERLQEPLGTLRTARRDQFPARPAGRWRWSSTCCSPPASARTGLAQRSLSHPQTQRTQWPLRIPSSRNRAPS